MPYLTYSFAVEIDRIQVVFGLIPTPKKKEKPMEMSDAELLERFEEVVADFGRDHYNRSHDTAVRDLPEDKGGIRSSTCIQGELMARVGIKRCDRPGSSGGVAERLGTTVRGWHALAVAQSMNDDNQHWGDILDRVRRDLVSA